MNTITDTTAFDDVARTRAFDELTHLEQLAVIRAMRSEGMGERTIADATGWSVLYIRRCLAAQEHTNA
jgi:hypothetical protein